MDWQLTVVVAVLAVSLVYLARASWRTWFTSSKTGCTSGCGKCSTPQPDATPTNRIRLPQV